MVIKYAKRRKMKKNFLAIVVPCYNEEKNILKFYQEVLKEIEAIEENIGSKLIYSFVFVNDGSKDNTLDVMQKLKERDDNVIILDFSRNFGKEAAILAGLKETKKLMDSLGEGDGVVILIDADLQHPIFLISKMYQEFLNEDCDIVYAKRINRVGESRLRAFLSNCFYKINQFLSDVDVPCGASDYRLMSGEVVRAILQMNEYHRFSKAIFEWVGYRKKALEYEYIAREEGVSSWSFWKLFKYAIEGFISFSTAPLRLAFIFGFFASLISLGYGAYILIDTLIYGNSVKGYPSLVCIITFFGGIHLIVLGIIGEYIARIYEQVKNRPHYFLKRKKHEVEK